MIDIIVALITSGITLVGVILSNNNSNKKIEGKIKTAQAVTEFQVEER